MDWSHFLVHRAELGGEGAADICKRVDDFWTQVILKGADNNGDNSDLIICSHGDPLYCLSQFLRGVGKMNDQDLYQLNDADYQPKVSLSAVIMEGQQVIKIDQHITPS